MATKSEKAIDIDLGTTYGCVGVWINDRVDIIPNDQGNRTTPSYFAFTDTKRLIGEAAKNQVALNPHNTVFDAKRLIGRRFTDPSVQSDMRHWPFKVVPGPEDKLMIVVSYKNEEKQFSPEEISSMVLKVIRLRISLRRKFGDKEDIKVEGTMFNRSVPSSKSTSTESEFFLHITFVVNISKSGAGEDLEIMCSAWHDKIEMSKLCVRKGVHNSPSFYGGPEFEELDDELQDALYQFLEERVISD